MKKIIVTGAKGQLGSEIFIRRQYIRNADFIFTDADTLSIVEFDNLKDFFEKNNPDLVINCAAYTAVDKAEDDFENALNVNAIGAKNISEICKKHDIPLIHISTDYVFDGTKNLPYCEDDAVNPLSVYGKTKLQGEIFIQESGAKYVIIRTSWLYSEFGNNFVKTILRISKEKEFLKVVNDQIGNPTYAGDLAEVILIIAKKYLSEEFWKSGIYHFSNEGQCSWYEFTCEILKIKSINTLVYPVSSSEFPSKVNRPKYSVLDKTKIKNTFQLTINNWRTSLEKCLQKLQ